MKLKYFIYVKVFFVLIVLGTFISCKEKNNTYDSNYIISIEDKIFHLDSISSFELLNTQLILENEQYYLLSFDRLKNSINVFDWNSGYIINKIPIIRNDDINTIFNPIYFLYLNKDSILLADQSKSYTLINNRGKIIDKWYFGEVISDEDEYRGLYAYNTLSNSMDLKYLNNNIYFMSTHISKSESIFSVFNIKNKTISNILKYPFNIDNILELDYIYSNFLIDTLRRKILFSFPAQHDIYYYDINDIDTLRKFTKTFNKSLFDISDQYNSLFNNFRYNDLPEDQKVMFYEKHDKLNRYSSLFPHSKGYLRLFVKGEEGGQLPDFEIQSFDFQGNFLNSFVFKNDNNIKYLVKKNENFILVKQDTLFIQYFNSLPSNENEINFKKIYLY
ncbi:DUF4221 domain-containing protein [Penaeicola halotolerans]|uniref:DUF4221 domain-containing protein n=1 Tax=Penaeicola halotolerans TaxID=2793196 RepID=UPI001CF90BE1|nr:DUF4221 domain-containing protein [Penaeicola halotolerans]